MGNKSCLKSDATSLLRLCCRASVCHSGIGAFDVASSAPRDEGKWSLSAFRRKAEKRPQDQKNHLSRNFREDVLFSHRDP